MSAGSFKSWKTKTAPTKGGDFAKMYLRTSDFYTSSLSKTNELSGNIKDIKDMIAANPENIYVKPMGWWWSERYRSNSSVNDAMRASPYALAILHDKQYMVDYEKIMSENAMRSAWYWHKMMQAYTKSASSDSEQAKKCFETEIAQMRKHVSSKPEIEEAINQLLQNSDYFETSVWPQIQAAMTIEHETSSQLQDVIDNQFGIFVMSVFAEIEAKDPKYFTHMPHQWIPYYVSQHTTNYKSKGEKSEVMVCKCPLGNVMAPHVMASMLKTAKGDTRKLPTIQAYASVDNAYSHTVMKLLVKAKLARARSDRCSIAKVKSMADFLQLIDSNVTISEQDAIKVWTQIVT